MLRRMLAVSFVLVLAAPMMADDKVDAKKLKGKWERETEGVKLAYEFKSDTSMKALLTPQGADKPIVVEIDYTLDKDGVLSAVITDVKAEEGAGGPAKGDKFTFKVEVGKETLIVSDYKGIGDENVKKLVEGEYKKKTD